MREHGMKKVMKFGGMILKMGLEPVQLKIKIFGFSGRFR
jgi:hypothetical protein